MKKVIAILAACAFMVSCQWWHETISSPEDCAVWYCEQIAEAEEDGDKARAEELETAFEEWLEGLDEEDQKEAYGAMLKWGVENM